MVKVRFNLEKCLIDISYLLQTKIVKLTFRMIFKKPSLNCIQYGMHYTPYNIIHTNYHCWMFIGKHVDSVWLYRGGPSLYSLPYNNVHAAQLRIL